MHSFSPCDQIDSHRFTLNNIVHITYFMSSEKCLFVLRLATTTTTPPTSTTNTVNNNHRIKQKKNRNQFYFSLPSACRSTLRMRRVRRAHISNATKHTRSLTNSVLRVDSSGWHITNGHPPNSVECLMSARTVHFHWLSQRRRRRCRTTIRFACETQTAENARVFDDHRHSKTNDTPGTLLLHQ